jgi:Ice-binding-like
MKRILMAGTAIAALFACSAAMAQSATNTPALLQAPAAYAAGEDANSSALPVSDPTARVDLGGAGHFVILSKSGITDVPASVVTGNIGTSPITGAADLLSCAEVTGRVYSVDAAGPAPCSIKAPSKLTNAIGDMQTAYKDAAGRSATITELGAGNIGGLTLAPGVYSWSTDVTVPTDVSLKGGSHAMWIFQISKNLIVSNGKAVVLRGHAQAQNVFWQVAGKVVLGTTSHVEGIVLSKTLIAMKTGASINGRLLAQTAVTLQKNSVTAP